MATANAGVHPGAIIALDVAEAGIAALPAILDHLRVSDLKAAGTGEMLRCAGSVA